jgi:hypothetical protein
VLGRKVAEAENLIVVEVVANEMRLVIEDELANEATPQTDEMYSGCRDRDRLKGLSGSG